MPRQPISNNLESALSEEKKLQNSENTEGSAKEDEASRVIQVAFLKHLLRKQLSQRQELEQNHIHFRRKSALRTVVIAMLRNAYKSLQKKKINLNSRELQLQEEKAAKKLLIALLRYQLARVRSGNDLLKSVPANLHEQDRWKTLLEKEEGRRESLLVEKLNVTNELRTSQDERNAFERMLAEERRKLLKAKEQLGRLRSDLESMAADKMEAQRDLQKSKRQITKLEDELETLQSLLCSLTTEDPLPIKTYSDTNSMDDEDQSSMLTSSLLHSTSSQNIEQDLRPLVIHLQCSLDKLTSSYEKLQIENNQLRQQIEHFSTTQDEQNALVTRTNEEHGSSIVQRTTRAASEVFWSFWSFLTVFRFHRRISHEQ